jgi:hypothetical protein
VAQLAGRVDFTAGLAAAGFDKNPPQQVLKTTFT